MEDLSNVVGWICIVGFSAGGIAAGSWSALILGRTFLHREPLRGTALWASTLVLVSPAVFAAIATFLAPWAMPVGIPALVLIAVVLIFARRAATRRRTIAAWVPLAIVTSLSVVWLWWAGAELWSAIAGSLNFPFAMFVVAVGLGLAGSAGNARYIWVVNKELTPPLEQAEV